MNVLERIKGKGSNVTFHTLDEDELRLIITAKPCKHFIRH